MVTVYPVIVVLEKVMKLHYSGHKLACLKSEIMYKYCPKRPPKPDQNPIPVKVVLKKYLFIYCSPHLQATIKTVVKWSVKAGGKGNLPQTRKFSYKI